MSSGIRTRLRCVRLLVTTILFFGLLQQTVADDWPQWLGVNREPVWREDGIVELWKGNAQTGIGGVLNTAILRDGHVYACGNDGRYTRARLATGERQWTTFEMSANQRRSSWDNVFTFCNRDRYFHATDTGDLMIARIDARRFYRDQPCAADRADTRRRGTEACLVASGIREPKHLFA